MATIHPTGVGHVRALGPDTNRESSRSRREGSAAGLLVAVGAIVAGLGMLLFSWAADLGQAVVTLGVLVLLPAAMLQALIGVVDGVRDHDAVGESRSAAYGLLGFVGVGACLLVAVVVGV